MKLNNKGLSIIELVVAIGLISIVILFLYRLLSDLNNELTNNDFAINNQAVRFDLINIINQDILNETINNIKYSKENNIIDIFYENGTSSSIVINTNTNKIMFVSKNSIKTTFEIKDASIGTSNIKLCKEDINHNISDVTINIPIYTVNEKNKEKNNNIIDDITINYLGEYTSDNIDSCLKN